MEPTPINPVNPQPTPQPNPPQDNSGPVVISPTVVSPQAPAAPTPDVPAPQPQIAAPTAVAQPGFQPQPAVPQTTMPADGTAAQPLTYAAAPVNTGPQTPGPVVSGVNPNYPPLAPSGASQKKRLMIIGGSIAGVLLLTMVAVFGFYLPNTPDGVFSRGLNRSGAALDKLVTEATSDEYTNAFKSSELTGSFKADFANETHKGTFGTKYDSKSSDSNFSYTSPTDQSITVDFLTEIAEKSPYPDIYFKINGYQTMGLTLYIPELAQYDNKWISVSSSYLESLASPETDPSKEKEQLTTEDSVELTKIVTTKTREYVFTTDEDKAVLVNEEFLGTEEPEEGVKANRYKVSIDIANAKAYCVDLVKTLGASKAYKKLHATEKELKKATTQSVKDCSTTFSSKTNDQKFDLWINKKTKLVYKLRMSDPGKKGAYVEIGQNYTKGDTLPTFGRYYSEEDEFDLTWKVVSDLKKKITKGDLEMKTTGEEKGSFTAEFTFQPYKGEVKINKPVDAIPVEQFLNAIGLGGAADAGGQTSTGGSQLRNKLPTPATNAKPPITFRSILDNIKLQ